MSKPFNHFESSIERGKAILALAETDPPEKDDLLRAACVLTVAAYDHYFTSKFCDVLNSYLKNNAANKELLDLLERAGLNTKSALEIVLMKRPFRRIRSLLANSLGEKTTHRTKAIDSLFSAIDLKGLSGRVHKKADRRNLGKRIDKLVDMRNDIVHSAHINSRGHPRNIDGTDIQSRISEVELFVQCSEALINEWVKKKNIPSVTSTT